MRKRLLSFVLAVLMIASLLPATALAADETVTRIAWVQKLVKTFDMTVEADNYPDNYYSDIDSSASYYKDLMIAVEFGVIDLEAGSAFEPDKPATREFAAHTLNFCLGFQLDEGVKYTYTDKDAVTYPEDVQVAVNRGWFQLSGGKFLPEQTVTSAEAANMFADAAKVRKGDKVQAGYDSKYVFTDGVVVVPSSVAAEIADDGSVIIPDTTVALKEGDTFVVFVEDFPRAFKAGSIANDGKQLTVTGEKVDINSVLVSIDAQGVVKGDLAQMQPNEGTQITYILSDDTETPDLMAALNGEKPIKSIHLSRTISGVTVTCNVESIVGEYNIRARSRNDIDAYVAVRGDATATCTIPFSMSAAGLPDTIELGSVPVGFLGSITVSARISVDGSVTLSYNTSFCAGVEYTSSGGFRVIRDFAKGSFTVSADLTLTMGVNITAAITELPVISGRCFAEIGAKCNYQAVTHPEPELPNLCIGIASWMYAKVGCSANISFGRFDETYGKTLDIWDRNNSPVRSVSHFEDDVLVPACTCDTTGVFGNYFTPVTSRYFNAGRANVVNMPVYKYSLDEDGNATITGYSGSVSALAIPQTIDGHTVVAIGDDAFRGTCLVNVTIPDTVTEIGDWAFSACKQLSTVQLSNNLTKLGLHVFSDCTSLTSIRIPKSLETAYSSTWYPGGPFSGCVALQSVELETGMTKIPGNLFDSCPGFTTITIPDTVTKIGDSAFSNCEKLESITIPDSVTEIGNDAFNGCTELKDVTLPNTCQNIVTGMFAGCTSLEKIVLPETVTAIRADAFKDCTSLKDITWSKAPEIIESRAFQNCSALTDVTIPDSVKSIGYGVFSDCSALSAVTLPDGVKELGGQLFNNCDALTTVTIPDSVTSIGEQVFYDCDALTTVTIPDSVTSIGKQAFYDCDALTTVKLGSGLKSIPESTFEHCDVLTNLSVPRCVTSIGNNAFKDCTKFTSVTIPRSVTSISASAFSYPAILTIYGVAGTYAETFAKENSIKFVDQQIKATAASLDKTELTINKGAAAQLNLSVTPENFTDIVDWKSTDTNIVTVSDNGVVKAVGVGTATVKVTVGDVSATCKVTVLQPVTGISLNKSSLTMDALGTFQMTASVYPDSANDKRITWSSSDPAIASVDENGLVTALKKGTATITAAAMDGSGVKSTCKVTVSNTAYVCTDPAQLESPHNYDNSCTDVWSYRLDGASSLNVTFDARTEMEDGFDYLYILDGSGKEVGKYTGKELAGKTVSVPGDTVQIRMASDKGNNAWGFKVTSVTAGSKTCQHVWDNGKVTKEPTETETGIKTYTCTLCGETKTETIPKLTHEHSYDAVVTAPTCTEKGYTTHTCACGDSYVDTYVDALGHAWDNGKVTKEPTETETGVKTFTCTRCGETRTETMPVIPHVHSYKDVVTAPTCTEKGYTTHTCACGDSYVDTYTDALGHAWDNGKVTKEPTETETGVKTFTCTRCGETKTETIPKLTHEHSYKAVVTAPTCTSKGYTTHTCACGDSYVDTYVDALGHAWDNGKVTKEPTETETGVKTFTCTRCGETKTEVIPALSHEHSYKDVVTAPTCTEKGYTTHTCACGDSYVDTYVDALGHAWDEGKVTKEPTETETGVKTFTCTRCGETKTETIPATGSVDVTEMFTDVSHSWADDGIQYCVTHQLMSGIGNNLFGPKLTTTRAQIVQILYNLEGEPKVSGTTPFTDLTQDWYQDAVLWAYQTGVVAGTSSTTFEPDRPVTREQIAVILMEYVTRVLKLERTWTPADLSIFPDAGSVSDWAKDAMADAVGLGLISGASNGGQTYLEPQGSATREQVATILMEFCKNVKK